MGRNGHGPKWLWAEMVMGRNGHGPKWLWAKMTRNHFIVFLKMHQIQYAQRDGSIFSVHA